MKKMSIVIAFITSLMQVVFAAPFTIPTAWFSVPIGENKQINFLQETMYSVINTIATEEVHDALSLFGLQKNISIIGFEKKPRFSISVLYLTEKVGDLLPLAAAVEKKLKECNQLVGVVDISTDGALFGKDVVVKITDLREVLTSLRATIGLCVDDAAVNKTFPFVPHVSLGKVRYGVLEEFVEKLAGISRNHEVLVEMSSRIKKRSEEAVAVLFPHNKYPTTITMRAVNLNGFDRAIVKEFVLKD